MLRKSLLVVLILIHTLSNAQFLAPEVPSTMEFGGIELKIDRNAQELIQTSVNGLTRHPKSFQTMVDRANIYFPLIERILREEGVPEDFKYLVLQESALVPNAVSTSNAVGYWQFKKESAGDVNVLVNGDVDERMHIAAATRGAARYLKKNNLYLNNWVNALLSYNTGLGGVRLLVKAEDANARKMKIEGTTHVYVLKFLAHKITFENALRKTAAQYTLLQYKNCRNKTLREIADELELSEEELAHYNQWLKTRKVPGDREHSIVVPASTHNYKRLVSLTGDNQEFYVASNDNVSTPPPAAETPANSDTKISTKNGLKAIIAGDNETIESLSKKGKVGKNRFIRYNELSREDKIIAGQIYYLQPKKNKAEKDYHTAESKETYWSVSQKYGIKKARLLRFNRIGRNEKLQEGRVLWLAETRPSIVPVEIKVPPKAVTAAKQEVQVIAYPDKRVPAEEKLAKSEEADVFPDDFYEESKTQEVAPSTSGSTPEAKSLFPDNVKMEAKPEVRDEGMYHEVNKGETMYSISKQYAVSIEDLKAWNNLPDNSLKLGQRLVIKKSNTLSPASEKLKNGNYITYRVQTGDSIYKIAKLHNVTIKQLQQWNNKTDNSIYIGEELKIYKN